MDWKLQFIVIVNLINSIQLSQQCNVSYSEHPEVITKYGPTRGKIRVSREGRIFHTFKGVPYAKPPLFFIYSSIFSFTI